MIGQTASLEATARDHTPKEVRRQPSNAAPAVHAHGPGRPDAASHEGPTHNRLIPGRIYLSAVLPKLFAISCLLLYAGQTQASSLERVTGLNLGDAQSQPAQRQGAGSENGSASMLNGEALKQVAQAMSGTVDGAGPETQASTDGILELTFEKAVRLGLAQNPSLQLQYQQTKLSDISLQATRDAYLPYISAQATAQQRAAQTAARTGLDGTGSMTGQIAGSLDLYTGGLRKANEKASEATLRSSRASNAYSREQLVFEIGSQYLQIDLNQSWVKVEQDQLNRQQKLLDQVKAYFDAGRRPISDVYQQQAQLKQTELALLNAERTLDLSIQSLLISLGLSPDTDVKVKPIDLNQFVPLNEKPNMKAGIASALKSRQDLNAQKIELESLQAKLEAAQAGMRPSLSLTATLGTGLYTSSTETIGTQLLEDNASATLGVSLNVPIFDQFLTRRSTESARIQLQQQQYTVRDQELQTALQLSQALTDYDEAMKRIEVAESQQVFAQQSLEAVQARYDVGAATLVEVIQARNTLLSAQYDTLSAQRDVAAGRMTLLHRQGALSQLIPSSTTDEQ